MVSLHLSPLTGTFKINVDSGKTYLLRIINAAMNDILFFSIYKHQLTVVAADASYTKPLTRDYITIAPGQTIDALLRTNQRPDRYYMAARAYSSSAVVAFDNTTTTAIVQYNGNYTPSSPLTLPALPYYNDTNASLNFSSSLRSLADKDHPISVPMKIDTRWTSTVSVNTFPCTGNRTCQGPNGSILAASMNNISFVTPYIDLLEAYYYHIKGVFGYRFPKFPPQVFNFTADFLPLYLNTPRRGTEVRVVEYGSTMEMVFQGTNVLGGAIDHPMHLHGFSFYVVGLGLGNFDITRDPSAYNLVDPPLRNTVTVPINGWAAIRFKADNPGMQATITTFSVVIKDNAILAHTFLSILVNMRTKYEGVYYLEKHLYPTVITPDLLIV